MTTFSHIVAFDERFGIGRDNDLPWRLSTDLRRFKSITMGHPIIMGRRTHASIGRVLPGRENIVLSRDPNYAPAAGAHLVASFDEAAALCIDADEAFVIGGAMLYASTLNQVDRIYLTLVHGDADADTHFPSLNPLQWTTDELQQVPASDRDQYATTYCVLNRRKANDAARFLALACD